MKELTADDGVRIAYEHWEAAGAGADRTPVVLLHGFAVDAAANWVDLGVVEALRRAGRHVVAPDARGHGRSDRPREPGAYGEDRMARDVSALVDALGIDAVDLVGYSMGAIVALIAATREHRVRRLVVGGVGAAAVELGGVDTRVLPSGAVAAALEAPDPATIADPEAARFRTLADAVGADRRALAAQAAATHASPIALDRIAVPTLILAGVDDPLADRPHVLAAAIAGARVERVAGDHLSAVLDPGFTAAIVDFLAPGGRP